MAAPMLIQSDNIHSHFLKFRLSYCSMQCHPQTSYEGLNLFLFNFFEGGFFVFDFQRVRVLITLFGGYVFYTYLCRRLNS